MDISTFYISVFVLIPFVAGACLAVYSFSTVEAAQQQARYKKMRNAAIGFGLMSIAAFMCLQVIWTALFVAGGIASAAVSCRLWRVA